MGADAVSLGRKCHSSGVGWTYWALLGVVGVAGLIAILIAALHGQAEDRRRFAEMARPPERVIPRFSPDEPAPAYVSDLESREEPLGALSTDLSDDERAQVLADRESATQIAAGYPMPDFATDRPSGLAVLDDAVVAVASEGAQLIQELFPIIALAQSRPLVIVAPELGGDIVTTLLANKRQRKLRVVVVWCPDFDVRDAICTATAATPLSRAMLQAGAISSAQLGLCRRWVCDHETSWISR